MRGLGLSGARRFRLVKPAPFTIDLDGWEYLCEFEEPEIISRRLVAKAIACPSATIVILEDEISWIGLEQQVYGLGFDTAPSLATWPVVQQLVRNGIAEDLGPAPADDTFTAPRREQAHKSLYPPGQFSSFA